MLNRFRLYRNAAGWEVTKVEGGGNYNFKNNLVPYVPQSSKSLLWIRGPPNVVPQFYHYFLELHLIICQAAFPAGISAF